MTVPGAGRARLKQPVPLGHVCNPDTLFVGTPPLPDADGHLLRYRGGRMWSQPLDD